MDLLDSIKSAADLGAIKKIADKLDIEEHLARKALAEELLPAVSAGLKENASTEEGAAALAGAVERGDHEKYLDDPDKLTDEAATEDGNKILGHALGSKEKSREVAEKASANTGISVDKLKKMLPMVAGLAMGGLSKVGIGGGNKKESAEGKDAESESSSGDESESSGGGESGSSGASDLVGKLSGMLDPDDLKKLAGKLF